MQKGKELYNDEINRDSLDEIADFMKKHNPSNEWEAEVVNFGWRRGHGIKNKFNASTPNELLSRILPKTDCKFKIFELEKNGLAIQNFHHDNNTGTEWYHVLPACEEEYHRDWDKDGICVKD